MSLAGRLALVTGSTSGIGLGIAKSLATNGAHLIINGFGSSHEIESIIKDFKDNYHINAYYDPANMTNVGEIESMIAKYTSKNVNEKSIDILVNNAGIQHVCPVEKFPVDSWNSIISINLSAVFHTTRLVLPTMKAKNWGRIINIASVHGLVGSADKSAYVASKHGVIGLTKVVALETARTGVTCNAICPGWVLTPLVQKQIDAKAAALKVSPQEAQSILLSEKQPSGGFVTPSQLGELASFLCSDAATEIRGQAWAMDGGWTAQ